MNTDQESLLASFVASSRINGNNGNLRWRKNLFLLLITFLIAICLIVYLYLNMEAIDGNQVDQNRYKPLSRRKPMLDHESIFSDSGPSMIKVSDLLAHCIVALRVAGDEVVKLSLTNNDRLQNVGSKGKTLEGVDDVVTGADLKSHRIILNTIKDSYRRLNVVSEEDDTHEFENKGVEDDILPIERRKFAQLLRNQLHEIEEQHAERATLIAQHETLVWIDPLDATKEYSENLTDYVTLMACIVYKSTPIAGIILKPFTNQTYWSIKDVQTANFYHSPDIKRSLGQIRSGKSSDSVKIIVSRSHAGQVRDVVTKAFGKRAEVVSAGGSGYKTVELLNSRADAYVHLTHIKKWDICAPTAILNSIPGGKLTDLRGNQIDFGNPKEKVVARGLAATLNTRIFEELINLQIKI